jgi:enoyl-CoA hydratase/carnithine racemase
MGSAVDMRDAADLLDKVGGTLVDVYAARTGLSAEETRAIMAAETWMTAEEALEAGFTDEVSAPEAAPAEPLESDAAAAARVTAVMSRFKKAPAKIRPDTRALIASMEVRACPRAALPRSGATAKTK